MDQAISSTAFSWVSARGRIGDTGTAGASIASAVAGEEDTAAAVVVTAAAEKTAAAVPMQAIAEVVEQ
jgi:hypothetical protein